MRQAYSCEVVRRSDDISGTILKWNRPHLQKLVTNPEVINRVFNSFNRQAFRFSGIESLFDSKNHLPLLYIRFFDSYYDSVEKTQNYCVSRQANRSFARCRIKTLSDSNRFCNLP